MKNSQRISILRHLAQGKPITPLIAFKKFSCMTASQRIAELKREGWPIISRMVKVGDKRVAEYRLEGAQ